MLQDQTKAMGFEYETNHTYDERDGERADARADDREGERGDDRNGEGECGVEREAITVRECEAIDGELRRIAKLRAGHDAEEAVWLRDAQRHQSWRYLGFSSAFEYLEDIFGYAPRTARERLRVAEELGALPEIETALRDGRLSYSAARELTRVATPDTQDAWLAAARGRNLRGIEHLTARRKRGDLPGDPPSDEIKPRIARLELSADSFALLRDAKNVIENEMGCFLEDEDFIPILCRRAIDGRAAASAEEPSRPAHQIAVTICEECRRGWQDAAGIVVEIGPNAIERAECDAQLIGDVDDSLREPISDAASDATRDATTGATRAAMTSSDHATDATRASTIEVTRDVTTAVTAGATTTSNHVPRSHRATATIPPATRRKVWRRDHGRCQVPGCRAARNLDIHHVRHRADGGDHDPSNLVVMCSGHHKLLHDGLLVVKGKAPDLTFTRRGVWLGRSTDAPTRFAGITLTTRAKAALVRLGIDRDAARTAIDATMAHVSHDMNLDQVVRLALDHLERCRAGS